MRIPLSSHRHAQALAAIPPECEITKAWSPFIFLKQTTEVNGPVLVSAYTTYQSKVTPGRVYTPLLIPCVRRRRWLDCFE